MTQVVVDDHRPGSACYTAYETVGPVQSVIKLSLIAVALWKVFHRSYGMACVIGVVALMIRLRQSDSVIALEKIGVQLEQRGRIFWLSDSVHFFPLSKLRGIVINEIFHGFSVIFILQIILEDADELIVVFPRITPRLKDLTIVRKGINSVLFGKHVTDRTQTNQTRREELQ